VSANSFASPRLRVKNHFPTQTFVHTDPDSLFVPEQEMRIMTPASQPQTKPHPRRDGWTAQRRRQFLDGLAAGLDVRRACARVGLSRQAAYKLRRRDAGFARAWGEALRAALAADEQRFPDLVAERLPWVRSRASGACELRPGEVSPRNRVHNVDAVSPSPGRHAFWADLCLTFGGNRSPDPSP